MKKHEMPESDFISGLSTAQYPVGCWFDDACILDMDHFIKNLPSIKEKGVRPDLVASIITNYASKWLPDICSDKPSKGQTGFEASPKSATAILMKKRFFVETLVGILPPEKDAVPCNFLLQLLRTASMIGVEVTYQDELERRISWQLDQASLKELMIPAFRPTCGTLLDVELVNRILQRFMNSNETVKSGATLHKVARLVDGYLAEAAIDANLTLLEFVALAGALPSHARANDDGHYRAIDTYLKVHPGVSKQERKVLCRLIDIQKLSSEAISHAASNERLPVRAVIQLLFSEQKKIYRQFDWSGSFSGTRSPIPVRDPLFRRLSKRDVANQQLEIQRLREDVVGLQSHCNSMQDQIERLMEKKKGFFKWKKLAVPLLISGGSSTGRTEEGVGERKLGYERRTPMDMRAKLVHGKSTPDGNRVRGSLPHGPYPTGTTPPPSPSTSLKSEGVWWRTTGTKNQSMHGCMSRTG